MSIVKTTSLLNGGLPEYFSDDTSGVENICINFGGKILDI